MDKINFENLPSTNTPILAENLNKIQDNTETEINYLKNYSTEEQVIGTWINGKPLYRRTITGTTPNTSSDTLIDKITNLETLIDIRGMIDNWVPVNSMMSDNLSSVVYRDGFGTGLYMAVGTQLYNKSIVVIAEYTKTTD